MENKLQCLSITLPFLLFLLCSSFTGTTLGLNRSNFPAGFTFGAASSAYQYEGAAFVDGKGKSIWDVYTHDFPEKILDGSNGDVAVDFYNRYKADVQLMKFIGLDAFRMSISWPRILPTGKLSGGVNEKGIAFYKNVFSELIANGITPFVTLFHWDLPQALEAEYEGFLSPLIVDDYTDFAEVCFLEFGSQVKYWITFNEPYGFSNGGYDGGEAGHLAPGRCSPWANCSQGDSATEPYIVGHNQILGHAAAVKLYREKFKAVQKGEIGITLVSNWFVPSSNNSLDVKAAQRALDFMYGWYINPLVYGEYPRIMRKIVGKRLPTFTKEQIEMVKGSFDFLGINYYASSYATHGPSNNGINVSQSTDNRVILTSTKNSTSSRPGVGFFLNPKGLYELLVYTKEKFKNPTIYITENGYAQIRNNSLKNVTADPERVNFYDQHLQALEDAVKKGVKVKGFIGWSFLDNFEWANGYLVQFGLCYVDFNNGLERIPKESALWFKNLLGKK